MVSKVLILTAFSALVVQAAAISPCSNIGGGNVVPVGGNPNTYCVSDWGSSDAWYPTFVPAVYDPLWDVFSGDDAVNLRYSTGGILRTGKGWLPPVLDAGNRAPQYNTGSNWAVQQALPLAPAGPGPVTSIIRNNAGMAANGQEFARIRIETGMVNASTFYQDYFITNNGGSTMQNVRFADYFNYHPNGSSNGGYLLGTMTYQGVLGLAATGVITNPNFIARGQMCLANVGDLGCSLIADDWEIGNVALGPLNFASPVHAVESNNYNRNNGPMGPGDIGGALAHDFGDILPGQQVSIRVLKGQVLLIADTPEPGTIILLLAPLAILLVRRRTLPTTGFRLSSITTRRDGAASTPGSSDSCSSPVPCI